GRGRSRGPAGRAVGVAGAGPEGRPQPLEDGVRPARQREPARRRRPRDLDLDGPAARRPDAEAHPARAGEGTEREPERRADVAGRCYQRGERRGPPPPERAPGELATWTVMARPSTLWPFSLLIAVCASLPSAAPPPRTPRRRDGPVSGWVMRGAAPPGPPGANSPRSVWAVVKYEGPPTYSLPAILPLCVRRGAPPPPAAPLRISAGRG